MAAEYRRLTQRDLLAGVVFFGVLLPPLLYFALLPNAEEDTRPQLSRRFLSPNSDYDRFAVDENENIPPSDQLSDDERRHREELAALRRAVEEAKQELSVLNAERRSMLSNIRDLKDSALPEGTERACPSVAPCVAAEQKPTESVSHSCRVGRPKQLIAPPEAFARLPSPRKLLRERCTTSMCFDMSRCSLTGPFRVYVWRLTFSPTNSKLSSDFLENVVKQSGYWTKNPKEACLYVLLLPDASSVKEKQKLVASLKDLPMWSGDGRNYLLIEHVNESGRGLLASEKSTGRALVATSSGAVVRRAGFDLTIPPGLHSMTLDGETWRNMRPILPAFRKYLLHFHGQPVQLEKTAAVAVSDVNSIDEDGQELFDIKSVCGPGVSVVSGNGEWAVCGSPLDRRKKLLDATFALLPDVSPVGMSSFTLLVRLMDALHSGAVPVVLQTNTALPFEEVIEWQKAAVLLPAARWPELLFVLSAISEEDVLAMRLQGRFLMDTYLGTAERVILTAINVVRRRVRMPAVPLKGVRAEVHHQVKGGVLYDSDYSRSFRQKFMLDTLKRWNTPPGALQHPPLSPFVPVMPSGWRHVGPGHKNQALHPVVEAGGSFWGETFRNYLGGMHPLERFTVVVLTYKRPTVLLQALQRLAGLLHLDRVVVVWNSPEPPQKDLEWPQLDAPIEVVKMTKNSLNNRFLPFDMIRTEAVLSLDDDTHLRHEEIDFAFRVWRENRDRIVGFPGRFHNWDSRHGGWLYNSNYSCELSMVLTGAAFLHKFYLHLYTFHMPAAVREVVDRYKNCEDLAMNCLVSHITRKPPIKVTLRWTFRCPGCNEALSEDRTHFTERHHCLNKFAEIFGYMPLLYTQMRTDSVLFKTRIPHTMEKCYVYV